jgi:hypothetical protein
VSSARKAWRAGHEHDGFEQSHRADHDPEEEHCAGGPRDVVAEHGRRVGATAILGTPAIVAYEDQSNGGELRHL